MLAALAAVTAAALAAPASAVVRPYPVVHACAATGETCSASKACESSHDFCDVASALEFRNDIRLDQREPHDDSRGVCVSVGHPGQSYRTACNVSRPSAQQCGQGMACRLNATLGTGTCVPADGGLAGDGCVDDTDCVGGRAAGNACGKGKTCSGIAAGGVCGGAAEAPGSHRACAPGLRCTGDAASAGVCLPRLGPGSVCANATRRADTASLLAGELGGDPCARGSVCASVSPGGDAPAPPVPVCTSLFSLDDGATLDTLPFRRFPDGPNRISQRHHHNATATETGPSLLCSSGFAQAYPMNETHYRLACADPVSSTFKTNRIGEACDPRRDGDALELLPYVCLPGLGAGMSAALAAPWQWRSDAVALVQGLATCLVGSADGGSATATGSCGRESSATSPGSCAYYGCFDAAAQVRCLSDGLIWDRATWAAFRDGVPACFADQTHLPEDIFACVWAGQHAANCTLLPGVGGAAGTCPYRPRDGLSAGERDGITIAVVFGAVGLIVVGVSCFALRSVRAKQEAERSRAWRAGGAFLGDDGALLGRHGDERPSSLNGDAPRGLGSGGGVGDGDFYAATAGRR